MDVKRLAVLGGGAVLGNMVADRFVIKADPNSPSGFILAQPGFGLDDIARGLTIAVTIMVLGRFIPH